MFIYKCYLFRQYGYVIICLLTCYLLLFTVICCLATLFIFISPTSFFVPAKNPGGGRRIGSQLQVFQSSRHRGHCRKGRRFFLPQNLVNAVIVFRNTSYNPDMFQKRNQLILIRIYPFCLIQIGIQTQLIGTDKLKNVQWKSTF
jgi:hypothetical protein